MPIYFPLFGTALFLSITVALETPKYTVRISATIRIQNTTRVLLVPCFAKENEVLTTSGVHYIDRDLGIPIYGFCAVNFL